MMSDSRIVTFRLINRCQKDLRLFLEDLRPFALSKGHAVNQEAGAVDDVPSPRSSYGSGKHLPCKRGPG